MEEVKKVRVRGSKTYTILKQFPSTGGFGEVLSWYDLGFNLYKEQAKIKKKELETEDRKSDSWWSTFKIATN